MKKYRLFMFACATLLSSIGVSAQTFSLDKDSSKIWWKTSGVLDVHIRAKNESAADIKLNWQFLELNLDSDWSFSGGCDNIGCYLYSKDIHTTDTIKPTKQGDFKLSFNGDLGAFDSKSYAAIEISNGSVKKQATFIAYKTAAVGISTAFLQDNEIAIFPNPAQNYIDVVYSPASDVKTIALYNLIGKVVSVYKTTSKNSARCEFNADMPSGIYVVRIADSKGNVIATRKITRQ